ncbi:hypothetical protein EJ02DRAFT_505641 [Clathrospora elynae]|uniref:Six-hairpin glycosidase n=1 Tax=Clathrospora elynae TaxID=706981 RepID=A0A6A5SEJ5_9PLEO|nr:hypothetical protein EJ02DRAFT_505641 [Clathrospora elynae]
MCNLNCCTLLLISNVSPVAEGKIDRKSIVQQYNLRLNQSHPYSPVQVGNGNYAFGVDVTGLQTFLPHNTLSSWGWHNSSLPSTPNQTYPSDYTGIGCQWLIANPHRINLGRVGLWFGDIAGANVTEYILDDKEQVLDLCEGVITSLFSINDAEVHVTTVASPETDTVAVQISSTLVRTAGLGLFFDFPYVTGNNKFDAPFVGLFNATANHSTTIKYSNRGASITHTLDATVYVAEIAWEGYARISRLHESEHKYILATGQNSETLSFTITYAPQLNASTWKFETIKKQAAAWWPDYWSTGGFISLPASCNSSANEIQRRTVLHPPPPPTQESGLVNNEWYGKFHMEMVFWHIAHWMFWGKWDLYDRSIGVYERFLTSSYERAQEQGYEGARLGKMNDPSGRSAPGEINSLLIWQQRHPMYFAEMDYRYSPTQDMLRKWDAILTGVADFMASYAYWNTTTVRYDLGPPMYPVSENSNPNATINSIFELAYWRFGLDVASKWQTRQNKSVPEAWTHVHNNLAPFPIDQDAYVTYEGIPDMWSTPDYTEDPSGLLGIYGWLPPDSRLNMTVFNNTVAKARRGDVERAVSGLLDVNNSFDGVCMPLGGTRVPTPSAAGLLLAVGMMCGGWDGFEGPVWPAGWVLECEGFTRAM